MNYEKTPSYIRDTMMTGIVYTQNDGRLAIESIIISRQGLVRYCPWDLYDHPNQRQRYVWVWYRVHDSFIHA